MVQSLRKPGLTLLGFILLFLVFGSPRPAFSDGIDFGLSGGVVQFTGGVNPLTGLVGVGSVFTGTPSNPETVLTCDSCFLEFQTGALQAAGPNAWDFAAGGFLFIAGTVSNGGTTVAQSSVGHPLLGGSFIGGPLTFDVLPGGLVDGFTVSAFVDNIDPDLTNFYGFDPHVGLMELHIVGVNIPLPGPDPFIAGVQDGVIRTAPVPEPSTLLLIGSGIIGISVTSLRKGVRGIRSKVA